MCIFKYIIYKYKYSTVVCRLCSRSTILYWYFLDFQYTNSERNANLHKIKYVPELKT